MKRHWVAKGLKFALFAVVFLAVVGFVVMGLWNWLMPALFAGARAITYWEALGMLLLARILFGRFGGGGWGRGHWRHRMWERWERMTPEERDQLRQRMQERCGARRQEG